MLFLSGSRDSVIATLPLPGVVCVNCRMPGTLTGLVISRYRHLFWIPAFSFGKTSISTCRHCKQVLPFREMSAAYQLPMQAAQYEARIPLTHFTLLLLLAAYTIISLSITWFEQRKLAQAPATDETTIQPTAPTTIAGLRYKVNVTDDGRQYGLIEVTAMTADSVEYRMTGILKGALTPASATQALHDSVALTNAHQRVLLQQWQYSLDRGFFKRL